MKLLILLSILLFPTRSLDAARKEILLNAPNRQSIFINSIWNEAVEINHSHQIPIALCIAQCIQESGWGCSKQSCENCNFFGVVRNGEYCKYSTKKESFLDYAAVLSQDCYGEPKNLAEWLNALECCGYAGDKQYTKRLKKIIEHYKLYLIK